MPGTMSIDGITSGLDTQAIIEKLTSLRQQAIKRLQDKQGKYTNQLTAWQDFNTRLLALKLKSDALTNPNTFGTKSVKSDDEKILTATATSASITGTYYVKVKQIAMAHQMQSQGYNETSETLGTGEIKITVAGKETKITLDANNNTLLGAKDAINRANAGVKAAIVDTGQANGRYKLIITSNTTGLDNAITADFTSLAGGESPTFTNLQAAQNAELELGSGAGAIQISKSSNAIKDVIPGVTLNLKSADTTRVLAVMVNQDSEAIKKSVQEFIDQYNNAVGFINEQFDRDSTTGSTGTLFGDFSLMTIQMGLASTTSNSVAGLNQTLKALSQIGIQADRRGKLSIGSDFDTALADNPEQVKALFSKMGTSTDPGVVFIAATSDTKALSAGYSVEITRLATKSRITAGIDQTDVLLADETLKINGKSIELKAGWTQQQVVDAINAKSGDVGVAASLTGSNGQGAGNFLTLTSTTYGSSTNITVSSTASNGAGTLHNVSGFGNKQVTVNAAAGEGGAGFGLFGYDVAGKINGNSCTGSGQTLTSTDGDSKGLQLMITGASTGSRGTVYFTQGIGSLVSGYVDKITEKSGAVSTAEETLNRQIADMKAQIEDEDKRMKVKQDQLFKQFSAMEEALTRLRDQSTRISSLFYTNK